MTGSSTRKGAGRLAFLDWTRGLAAVTMLNGHAFHAFTRTDLRDGGPYVITQFIGGMPPAVFLFLVGVTLAFLMDSSERKGVPVGSARVEGGAPRRLPASDRVPFPSAALDVRPAHQPVDRPAARRRPQLHGTRRRGAIGHGGVLDLDRVRLSRALGLAIAGLAPLVSAAQLARLRRLCSKRISHPTTPSSGFFPWAAFVAFGMSAGSIIRLLSPDQYDRARAMGRDHRLRPDPRRPILLLVSLFGLREIRVLAQQPVAGADQNRRQCCWCWPSRTSGRRHTAGQMELDPTVRRHLAAGLLGAHRAGVRTLAVVLARGPYGGAR